MELWIRSQDKLQLLKVEDLEVYDGGNKANNHFFIKCLGNYIGEYTTKERALEILDEIQSLIDFMVCKEIFTYDSEEFMQLTYKQIQHIKENGCIYEMPKE